jgi:hypothetical protein
VGISRREGLALLIHGRRSGDEDEIALLDGPAISDFGLPRRFREDALCGHGFLSDSPHFDEAGRQSNSNQARAKPSTRFRLCGSCCVFASVEI